MRSRVLAIVASLIWPLSLPAAGMAGETVFDDRGDADTPPAADLRRITAAWRDDGGLEVALLTAGPLAPAARAGYWIALDLGGSGGAEAAAPPAIRARLRLDRTDLLAGAAVDRAPDACGDVDVPLHLIRTARGDARQKRQVPARYATICTSFSAFDETTQQYRDVQSPSAQRLTARIPPAVLGGATEVRIQVLATDPDAQDGDGPVDASAALHLKRR